MKVTGSMWFNKLLLEFSQQILCCSMGRKLLKYGINLSMRNVQNCVFILIFILMWDTLFLAMERRDPDNRRKIPRFTSKPVYQNIQTLIKISHVQQGLFLATAIYLLTLLIFVGKSFLATALIGGGSLIFAAFRLRDLNEKSKLYLENESVTNMARATNAIVLMWLLYTFLFLVGAISLVMINWDTFLIPFTTFLS